jgi:hypothetical protein
MLGPNVVARPQLSKALAADRELADQLVEAGSVLSIARRLPR